MERRQKRKMTTPTQRLQDKISKFISDIVNKPNFECFHGPIDEAEETTLFDTNIQNPMDLNTIKVQISEN